MTAADLRREHENIRFHFYSGDAMDVLERLDHGNLDFAVMLEPVDTVKYDFLSLPERSEWGVLMKSDCEFAKKQVVTRTELEKMPLILHQRIGLQEETGGWCEFSSAETVPADQIFAGLEKACSVWKSSRNFSGCCKKVNNFLFSSTYKKSKKHLYTVQKYQKNINKI